MRLRTQIVLLLCAVWFLPDQAAATTCALLSYSVDDARSRLRRAANEDDLDNAKDHARRAKNALDDAAMAALDCQCTVAYSEFDDAARRARRARDADGAEDFADQLNRAIRSYNSAIQALRTCRLSSQ